MELIKNHVWEGKNFKDILRREVLEFIVKGFEHIFKTVEEPKDFNHFGQFLKGDEKPEEKKDPSWF